MILAWLAIATIAGVSIQHARQGAVGDQTRELRLLSLALADEIDRGLAVVDEGFSALRSELRDGRLPVSGVDAPQLLRTRADLMPLVDSLWIFDRHGHLLTSSDASRPPALASFVPTLDSLQGGVLSVARPFDDEVSHANRLAIAVGFAAAPGAPDGGWIVGAIPSAALLGAFASAALAPDVRAVVFREDGARLAALNFGMPRQDESEIASHLDDASAGAIRRFRDGSDNLVAVRSVPRHRMTVVVARDLRDVLSGWRAVAEVRTLVLLLLLAFMLVAMHLVTRADRRRARAQLDLQTQRLRATRLESLGTLAGGVAHDFNNVLAGIIGFAEMARDAAVPESRQAHHIDQATQAALRGKALTDRILSFSTGGGQASSVFVLQEVVVEVLDLIAVILPPGIALERALHVGERRVRGDPMQAFEAVMNLCSNAIQAMPDGGVVTVRLESVEFRAERILSHSALGAGRYLAVTVMDGGKGIDLEAAEHLFEPFFTTRGSQGGTGLGLFVVHGVVARFGGGVDLRSAPGGGATFTLYFPESSEPLALTPPPDVADVAARGRGEAILLVDDDADLIEMGTEMLRGLGYDATGTCDALDALRQIENDPARYAALITDESMPCMSGTELATLARNAAPGLPILILSGHGGASLPARAEAAGAAQRLAKPLLRASLAAALRTLLG
ncbi:MAG: ATP-binding protein [Caldimonas sp.]